MESTLAPALAPKSRKLKYWLIGLAVFLLILAGALYYIAERLGPSLRTRVVEILRERYQADVQLQALQLSLFPRIHVTGEGLVLYMRGRTDLPPLISVDKFTINTGFSDVLTGPRRVNRLILDGLKITVSRVPPTPNQRLLDKKGRPKKIPSFVIDEVIADGTTLTVIPLDPQKDPLVFELRKLTLHSAGPNQPMRYKTSMTNALPPGSIEAHGTFGPWQADEPVNTPLTGDYTFRNADLSVFKGIAGILSSDGSFKGRLDHIETQGSCDVPDFRLNISGHPVDLKTEFHSIVDGGDGDTLLQPVKARFRNTSILATGGVTGKKGVPGKTVKLDLAITDGRMEDLLWLALKAKKPFITGRLDFKTKFLLPPGKRDVIEKLGLDGQFNVSQSHFTTVSVQDKLDGLSHRAEGHPNEPVDEGDVVSNMKGRFMLGKSEMSFPQLSFGVPGALIQLYGTFGLSTEQIDFHGTARTEAKLSQMTTGFKSVLLKAVDPFFKKNGAGAEIPIKITGTREHPSFGLDLRREKK